MANTHGKSRVLRGGFLRGIRALLVACCCSLQGCDIDAARALLLAELVDQNGAELRLELKAGRVYYAAYVGGGEWRATFEALVLNPQGINIRDDCRIFFSWKRQEALPQPGEGGWSSVGSESYGHGLMSIDGIWLNRKPNRNDVWWMRVEIKHDESGMYGEAIGRCGFTELKEEPDRTWDMSLDLGYGLADQLLASTIVKKGESK